MGIFGALTTSVSGLRAQSFALENISGNIANSRTTGFKRVDTAFTDLIPDSPPSQERAGSVRAFSQNTTTLQGDLIQSGVSTNLALNGEGFFVVQERSGFAGGTPTFGGIDLFTRRGDFELDNSGYLRNGAGYYLKGISIDPTTGSLIGSQPNVLRVSQDNLPARATARVDYRANLPTQPDTPNSRPPINGSNQMTGAGLVTGVGAATVGAATITAADESAFINNSVPGGAITAYSGVGAPVNIQYQWARIETDTTGPFVAGPNRWALYYRADSSASPAPAATRWSKVGDFEFDATGNLTAPAAPLNTTYTVDGVATASITQDFGNGALTQFAFADRSVNVNSVTQDGYESGDFADVRVGDGGRLYGTYSNGQVVALAQLSVAKFAASNALKRRDGGVFEGTLESGQPILANAGRELVGGSIENSNTDIADEFSKMIVTQQAYSANTRVISTAQTMLQDIINVIR
jgi:flagellar hook protein FlgE